MNSEGRITRAEALARKAKREDVERAERLRRSANLPGRKPGTGPRIAR